MALLGYCWFLTGFSEIQLVCDVPACPCRILERMRERERAFTKALVCLGHCVKHDICSRPSQSPRVSALPFVSEERAASLGRPP